MLGTIRGVGFHYGMDRFKRRILYATDSRGYRGECCIKIDVVIDWVIGDGLVDRIGMLVLHTRVSGSFRFNRRISNAKL